MNISGRTRLIPMIGHRVAHVHTPSVINRVFAARGLDIVMVPFDVALVDTFEITDFLRQLSSWENLIGCTVTHPYKQLAYDAVDEATPRSDRLRAVNTIRRDASGRLVGEMTDGGAMIEAILAKSLGVAGKSALVVGAGGGAGLAIIDALHDAGATRIGIMETNTKRRTNAIALINKLSAELIEAQDHVFDIVINSTPLGIDPNDPLPISDHHFRAETVYCDAVASKDPTPFIKQAAEAGAITVTGADMGDHQVPLQFEHWGLEP